MKIELQGDYMVHAKSRSIVYYQYNCFKLRSETPIWLHCKTANSCNFSLKSNLCAGIKSENTSCSLTFVTEMLSYNQYYTHSHKTGIWNKLVSLLVAITNIFRKQKIAWFQWEPSQEQKYKTSSYQNLNSNKI